jgi:hypothetical protein
MKTIHLTIISLITLALLSGCLSHAPLSKNERCDQIQRQMAFYKQPNSGYSWDSAQYRISQLKQQAKTINC